MKELKDTIKTQLTERQKEELHLDECVKVIQQNIDDYLQKYQEANAETKDRKSTRLNSSHSDRSRMPSSA